MSFVLVEIPANLELYGNDKMLAVAKAGNPGDWGLMHLLGTSS